MQEKFWSQELRTQLSEALLKLDTLSLKELDSIMCLMPGGEFDGLSAGDIATTSKDETVVVLAPPNEALLRPRELAEKHFSGRGPGLFLCEASMPIKSASFE